MQTIQFLNPGKIQLAERLSIPFEFISTSNSECINIRQITIWYSDGIGIKIRSKMHDISERKEVGVLLFTTVHEMPIGEFRIPLSCRGHKSIVPKKLIVVESGIKIESGILLHMENVFEFVVVAGAFPTSLAVRGTENSDLEFESEYPFENYLCVPI